jgi:[acyl-carrier-protein] S-malonyltransferase
MGKDLYETYPLAQELYQEAEKILDLPLRKLSFEGPEEELKKTVNTQPAVLVHSIVCFELLRTLGIKPWVVCGHSLGEYSALYAARVFTFEEVLKIVKRRATLMYEEGLRKPGTMAAIIGLDFKTIEELCKEIPGTVVAANYNAPGQLVVSGEIDAVKKLCERAKDCGALKCVMLEVSGAFHSPLLEESYQEFKQYLKTFEFKRPEVPVIPNRTGEVTSDLTLIKEALEEQLISPVLWSQSIINARDFGAELFIEVGPQRVLSGLVKRIDRNLEVINIGTKDELKAFLENIT